MSTTPITDSTDCAQCAGQNQLPTLAFSYIALPPYEDRKDYFDIGRMEGFLKTYRAEEKKVTETHETSAEIFHIWANRTDSIYAKTVVIQNSLGGALGNSPDENFEEFQVFDYSVTTAAILSALTGAYGVVSAYRAVSELAETATKWQRFKAKGGLVLTSVTTIVSLTILFINEKRRTDALIEAIPNFQRWLYGVDNDTKKLIENPTAETARGAVGTVNAIHTAVAEMIARITALAEIFGIATKDEDGEDIDPEIIYCEVEKALIGATKTAAELEASYAIATRMICLDNDENNNIDFSDQDISQATGLPDTLVARRRDDVASDPSLCTG